MIPPLDWRLAVALGLLLGLAVAGSRYLIAQGRILPADLRQRLPHR